LPHPTQCLLGSSDSERTVPLDTHPSREDGLDATYLASNLRPGQPQHQGGPGRSVSERLAELESLKKQGLVTQAEYDERRAAILESL